MAKSWVLISVKQVLTQIPGENNWSWFSLPFREEFVPDRRNPCYLDICWDILDFWGCCLQQLHTLLFKTQMTDNDLWVDSINRLNGISLKRTRLLRKDIYVSFDSQVRNIRTKYKKRYCRLMPLCSFSTLLFFEENLYSVDDQIWYIRRNEN